MDLREAVKEKDLPPDSETSLAMGAARLGASVLDPAINHGQLSELIGVMLQDLERLLPRCRRRRTSFHDAPLHTAQSYRHSAFPQ